MAGILEDIHPALKSLWELENELRSAAQNAIFLRSDDAKKHMEEARRHYQEALTAIKKEMGAGAALEHPSDDRQPETDNLKPTGAAQMPRDTNPS